VVDVDAPVNRRHSLRFWVALTIAGLVASSLATAAVAKIESDRVSSAQNTIRDRLRPAQRAEADLLTAYINQETGQRGFLLTGDASFLQPYKDGRAAIATLRAQLDQLMSADREGRTLLDAAIAAGTVWQQQSAGPEIAARGMGTIPVAVVTRVATQGKRLFDDLRAHINALTQHTDALVSRQLARVSSAQHDASTATNAALISSVAVALLAVVLLTKFLTRPLDRLLGEIQTVAAGDYHRSITATGPNEVQIVASAVERMRDNIVRANAEVVLAQQSLSVRDERARLAADLHDLTIQRVFALGLALNAEASRTPAVAGVIEPLIDETDRIIRELRNVIFAIGADSDDTDGLRAMVIEMTSESRRSLGFAPDLEFRGPLDTDVPEVIAAELLAVIREVLSNIARHAKATSVTVLVALLDDTMHLVVADNGVGMTTDARAGEGTRNIRSRAERLGGGATISPGPDGGTQVVWRVPVPPTG
jgi:signal transduction histidine kinase